MGLKDLGNGLQVFVPDEPDTGAGLKRFKETLSLIDLANRVNQAELDEKVKKADFVLKAKQIEQAPLELAIKQASLIHQQAEEQRKQAQFISTQLSGIHDVYAQSPEMGRLILKKSFGPNADSVTNPDGTETIAFGTKAFTIDPHNVADPEKKQNIAKGYREEWLRTAKDYQSKSQAFMNIQKSYNVATGAADISLLYNFMKVADPSIESTVREGELALGKATASIPQEILNQYNKAVSSNAPVFGPPIPLNGKIFSIKLSPCSRRVGISRKNAGNSTVL